MKKILASAVLAAASAFSASVFAVTPAEMTISNTATLTYGAGTTVNASVDVIVGLTPATPNITNPGATPTGAAGSEARYNLLVTTSANGSDAYTLGVATGSPILTDATGSVTASYEDLLGNPITDVTLGATAIAQAVGGGATVIVVPQDQTPGNGSVNSLVAGDVIVIAGTSYTIASIDDTSSPVNVSITLTTPLVSPLTIGTLVAEQKTVVVVVDLSNVTITGPTPSVNVEIEVDNGVTTPGTGGGVDITILAITFNKYVRNLNGAVGPDGNARNPSAGSGVTVDGNEYWTTGNVQAYSGDTIEYVLVVENGGTAALTNVRISDTVPAFSSFTTGAVGTGTTTTDVINSVNLAAPGIELSTNGTPGEVDPATSAIFRFQVTLD